MCFFTNEPPQIIAGHLKLHSALAGCHINIIHLFNRAFRGVCRRRKGNTGQFSARNLPNLANSVQKKEFSTCSSQCRVSEMNWLIAVSHVDINYISKLVSRAYCQGRKWDKFQISTKILIKSFTIWLKRHELITIEQVHECSETCNSGSPGCFFVSAACSQKHCLLVYVYISTSFCCTKPILLSHLWNLIFYHNALLLSHCSVQNWQLKSIL